MAPVLERIILLEMQKNKEKKEKGYSKYIANKEKVWKLNLVEQWLRLCSEVEVKDGASVSEQ